MIKDFGLIFFFFLSHLIFGDLPGETGGTFEDHFKQFDSAIWQKDHHFRHCGGKTGGCIWATMDNIRYLSYPPIAGLPMATNEMRITMKNDCRAKHCCQDFHHCTSYTSGHLTSVALYGYGSYYFMMKTGEQPKGVPRNEHASLACLSIRRMVPTYHDEMHMGIAMCFPSEDPTKARLIARYGDEVYHEDVTLPFDASKRIGLYRIDWHPDVIVWNVNRVPVGAMHYSKSMIPDYPLHIKLFLVPQDSVQTLGNVSAVVEQKMHMYMTGFQKYDGIPDAKTELLVINANTWREHMITFIITSGILGSIIFLGICLWWKPVVHIPHGYKSLPDDKTIQI